MKASFTATRNFLLLIGLSVSHAAIAELDTAMISQEQGHQEIEKEEKKKKRKIRVVRSGDTVIVDKNSNRKIIAKSGHVKMGERHKEALQKAKQALEEVNVRLGKTDNSNEKAALEAARAGLEVAIQSLEQSSIRHVLIGPGHVRMAELDSKVLHEAIKDLEIREGEIATMRLDMKGDLAEARAEIEDALGEVELEIDLDGDLRTIRIESLKAAELSLEGMEQRHLDALLRAEEGIKRERERLEKRLQRRKKEAEEKERDN